MAYLPSVTEGAFRFDEMFQEDENAVPTGFNLSRNVLKDLMRRPHDPPQPVTKKIVDCCPFYSECGCAVREALASGKPIIMISGYPGCGKTASVPYLVHEARPAAKVVVEQPRRFLAEKSAEFAGQPRAVNVHGLSNNIKEASSKTCVVFYTPGLGRPLLEEVHPRNVVTVFFEFHCASLSTLRCFRYCVKFSIQTVLISATPHPNEAQNLLQYYNDQVEDGKQINDPVVQIQFESMPKFPDQYLFFNHGSGSCEVVDNWRNAEQLDFCELDPLIMLQHVVTIIMDVYRRGIHGTVLIFCAELAFMKKLFNLLHQPEHEHLVRDKKVWIYHSLYNFGSFNPTGDDIVITNNGLQDGVTIADASVCVQTCVSRISAGFSNSRIKRLQTVPSSSTDLIQQSGRISRKRKSYVYSIQSPGSYNKLRSAPLAYLNVENLDSDAEFIQGCREADELFEPTEFYGNHIEADAFAELQNSLRIDGAISRPAIRIPEEVRRLLFVSLKSKRIRY